MPQSENEKRIRAMWSSLPGQLQNTPRAIPIFAEILRNEHPALLFGFDGDLTEHLKKVLDGMYKQ